MNKKELIEKYKELENGTFDIAVLVVCQLILKDLELLDEPQPVKVPQFVADWIEVCKEHLTTSLYTAMNPSFMRENNQSFDLALWIKNKSNQELFALAWMFGYTVENEKRYLVKVKGIVCNSMVLKHNINEDTWYMSNKTNYTDLKSYHTRKELEQAKFDWVFDCPGIKIEEVKDE